MVEWNINERWVYCRICELVNETHMSTIGHRHSAIIGGRIKFDSFNFSANADSNAFLIGYVNRFVVSSSYSHANSRSNIQSNIQMNIQKLLLTGEQLMFANNKRVDNHKTSFFYLLLFKKSHLHSLLYV